MAVTWLLLRCYMAATWLLYGCYMAATWLLHGCYMAVTRPLHVAGEGGLANLLYAAPSRKLLGEDEEGKLHVSLLMGWGFFAAHRDGLPDVVVKLTIGGVSQRSRAVSRTLSPSWGARGQDFWWGGAKADLLSSKVMMMVIMRMSTTDE